MSTCKLQKYQSHLNTEFWWLYIYLTCFIIGIIKSTKPALKNWHRSQCEKTSDVSWHGFIGPSAGPGKWLLWTQEWHHHFLTCSLLQFHCSYAISPPPSNTDRAPLASPLSSFPLPYEGLHSSLFPQQFFSDSPLARIIQWLGCDSQLKRIEPQLTLIP